MNTDQLKRMDGRVVRLRPPARRMNSDGTYLRRRDDEWRVETRYLAQRAAARLVNIRTMHFIDLFADSVQEYREPDTLILKVQYTLRGNDVLQEPLADRRLAYARRRRPRPRSA